MQNIPEISIAFALYLHQFVSIDDDLSYISIHNPATTTLKLKEISDIKTLGASQKEFEFFIAIEKDPKSNTNC